MSGVTRDLAAVAILIGIAGCGGEPANGVYPVRGQVLYRGRPVANAQITFHPVSATGKDGVRPVGRVDEQGQFTLTTFKRGDGAPPGEYRVTVIWYLATPTRPGSDDTQPVNYLPAKYADAETSQLTATVIAGNNDLQPFALK